MVSRFTCSLNMEGKQTFQVKASNTFDVLENTFDVVWYSFKKIPTIALARTM